MKKLSLRSLSLILALLGAVVVAGLAVATHDDPLPITYLDEDVLVPAGGDLYQFWYTSTCANGDPFCECDDEINDINHDGVIDSVNDYDRVDACLAQEINGARVVVDDDGDGTPDIVDPDFTGGADGTTPESMANKLPGMIDTYVTWGLEEPFLNEDPAFGSKDIWIYNAKAAGFAYPDGSRVELMAERLKQPDWSGRQTLVHELWHTIQHAYDANAGAGKWSVEGQARMIEDKIWPEVDTDPDSSFIRAAQRFTSDPNQTTMIDVDGDGTPETIQPSGLLGTSYSAALWWSYLIEQAGSEFSGTPGEGMDFLRTVLELADFPLGLRGWIATDTALGLHTGRGFDETYWDFTIANHTKDSDVSQLSADYLDGRNPMDVLRYRDQEEGNFTLWYGPVPRTEINGAQLQTSPIGSVPAITPGVDSPDSMPAYGVKYFDIYFPAAEECPLPTWQAFSDSSVPLMHSLIVRGFDSNGDARDDVTALYRHKGTDFARSIIRRDTARSMTAVVATGGDPTGFTWNAGCLDAGITIEQPTTQFPAGVGAPGATSRVEIFLTVKDVSGVTEGPVNLDWNSDFRVTVDDVEATILNGDYVQNQYWLLAEVPTVPGAAVGSLHDLTVELIGAGVSDTQADAILFDLTPIDQVLVLDRSGSMNDDDKLQSAQAGARIYVDGTNPGEQLGVVSFSNAAITESELAVLVDQDDAAGVRAAAHAAIDGITASGQTSIGSGLRRAQDLLDQSGNPDAEPWILLLSDGRENVPPNVGPILNQRIIPAGTQVMAFALGGDADVPQMRDIAARTCGAGIDRCLHVLGSDGDPVMAAAPAAPAALTNEIADVYLRMREVVAGRQRLWQEEGAGSSEFVVTVEEAGGRDALFSFNWDDAAAPLTVNISGPGGIRFVPLTDKLNHVTYYTDELVPGEYTVTIKGDGSWIGRLAARQTDGAEMHAFVETPSNLRRLFLPAQLQVILADEDGPVTGAAVVAKAYRGEDGTSETIVLRDDGVAPHDDQPNDGVYGYSYNRINSAEYHVYTFDIEATGPDFTRYARLTYHPANISRPDQDGDGLVDYWQDLYDVTGADEDPDFDGLTNRGEMLAGTDPTLDDTDFGGQNDGSEVANGRDPLAGDDDEIPPVSDFWCADGQERVTLHFNWRSEFEQIRVYKADLAKQPVPRDKFKLIAEFDLGTVSRYVDEDVDNGLHYLYLIQPLAASGKVIGSESGIVRCRPAEDPFPPAGHLVINDHAAKTQDTTVLLRMTQSYEDGEPEITSVMLSNSPSFQNVKWQPFAPEMTWEIEPDKETGVATVYALFADDAGNISEDAVFDSIQVGERGPDEPAEPSEPAEPTEPTDVENVYLPFVLR